MGSEDGGQTTNGRRRFVPGAFGAKSAMFGCSRGGGGGEGPRGSKVLCHGAGGAAPGAPWGGPQSPVGVRDRWGGVFESLWRVGPEGLGEKGGLWVVLELEGAWGSPRLRGRFH